MTKPKSMMKEAGDAGDVSIPLSKDMNWTRTLFGWKAKLLSKDMTAERLAELTPDIMIAKKMFKPELKDKYADIYEQAKAKVEARQKEIEEIKEKYLSSNGEIDPEVAKWILKEEKWFRYLNPNTPDGKFEALAPEHVLPMLIDSEMQVKYKNFYDRIHAQRKHRAEMNASKALLDGEVGKTKDALSKAPEGVVLGDIAHFILRTDNSTAYKDGVSLCNLRMAGNCAFGNPSKQNVFQLLISVQEQLRKAAKGSTFPDWVLLAFDSSAIYDSFLRNKLRGVKDVTHMVVPYGISAINALGQWWLHEIDATTETTGGYAVLDNDGNFRLVRGCKMTAGNPVIYQYWGDKNAIRLPRRTLIGDGPFCAVRGNTFMGLDFTDIAAKMGTLPLTKHYMIAHLSLLMHGLGHRVATINTLSGQFGHMSTDGVINREALIKCHKAFMSIWSGKFPIRLAN